MRTLMTALLAIAFVAPAIAEELSPYMGGSVELVTAPNGATAREEVLETAAKVVYLEPTTEKLADGVWCIGGYSLANTTVIEGDHGLVVYVYLLDPKDRDVRQVKAELLRQMGYRTTGSIARAFLSRSVRRLGT